MHLVTIPNDLDLGRNGPFEAGTYVMEDRNAAELMLSGQCPKLTLAPCPNQWVSIEECKRIIVAGGLGMGDAIMLTPALRALKAKSPEIPLFVACFAHFRQALLNLPYIDGFTEWPIREDQIKASDRIVFLENFQFEPTAKTTHLTDVFAERLGVDLNGDTRADYIPTADEVRWAISSFPRVTGRKRLGMQVQASERCRTYPAKLLRDLMQLAIKDGWEVYLMGAPGEYQCEEKGHLHDLCQMAPSFRESAAFLTTCDAFVGPDSGFLHVVGAMNIPAVGLFGAFPWKLRTAYYPSVFAIQGIGPCTPCFYSPSRLMPAFPTHGPCAGTGRCEVLATIEPERILAKINQQILNASLEQSP